MGSSYFGEPNMGNERGGSSSRKGKKSNSDKPKQPQRGLGVAQLEKIRLHGQMGSSYHPSLHGPYPGNFNQEDMRVQTAYSSMPSSSFSYSSTSSTSSASYGFHPSMMMGLGEYDQRANIRYGDSQPSTAVSWNPGSGILDTQHFAQPNMTRQLLNLHVEDSQPKKSKKHRSNSVGSSSQNSESSDTQELDLELRLSFGEREGICFIFREYESNLQQCHKEKYCNCSTRDVANPAWQRLDCLAKEYGEKKNVSVPMPINQLLETLEQPL